MKRNVILSKPKLIVVMMACVSAQTVNAMQAADSDQHKKVYQLETIVVSADQDNELQKAKANLEKVTGGVNLVNAAQLEQGKSGTTEDIFALQPGVYAKSSGNEGTKISIRGSGINRAPGAHGSGVYVLLDDIPLTGAGGTPYELLEPLWLNHVEVFKGANGFDKGALALGGAINYVTKTGKDAERLQLRYETGSRGFQKYALSSGQQFDHWDYYISLNASKYDGYQDHGEGDSQGLAANLGYQISPDLETRFYLRYRETEHQSPGRLTKKQIKDDPQSANSYNLQYDAKRIQPGTTWFANKTTLSLDNGGILQGGLAYHHYPMDLRESPYRIYVDYEELTASLSYQQPYQLFGLNSNAQVLLRSTSPLSDSKGTESLRFDHNGYSEGTVSRKYIHQGSDNVIQIMNESEIQPNLWISAGLAGIYTQRETKVYYPVTNEGINEKEWDFAPRLGLRYDLDADTQLYANISKSIEPAHPWSLIWGSNKYFPQGSGAATGRMRAPIHLDHQEANTIEIGSRGQGIIGEWDINYYYSTLKNELLSVEISPMPNPIIAESNASDTIHQGLELGLNTILLSKNGVGDLSLRQSYTYSDFRYKNDAVFNKNHLAGLAKHFYQAQLKMDFDNGLFASLNTEYVSKIPMDYANTMYTDAYNIWGASIGYQPANKKWHTWIDFKNIGDKKYAATVTPGYNDKGLDAARLTPGEGFSTYAGVAINF